MKPSNHTISLLLCDPVTLVSKAGVVEPYLFARVGAISNKNLKEAEHFLKAYKPKQPSDMSYATRINVLPKPDTSDESLILDVGCGPNDYISAIPGRHIFLDDIMDVYVDKLAAAHDGLRVCARTELMPLASSSIDIIYSINMIDHVDDMPETIAEIHRVLKPGGKVYLQTYFNSHPLLETEPGVFDRYFLDHYIRPLFDFERVRTYAIGDPAISSSYTMDVLAAVLVAKVSPLPIRKSRNRYVSEDYIGPQSLISNAIREFSAGRDASHLLGPLEFESCYDIHRDLLLAWGNIVRGEFGSANSSLKKLLTVERIRKNPYARIALLTLENRRISAASQNRA